MVQMVTARMGLGFTSTRLPAWMSSPLLPPSRLPACSSPAAGLYASKGESAARWDTCARAEHPMTTAKA